MEELTMSWKININVQAWKKDQIVSEEDLVAQGGVISDWEKSLLIIKQGVAKSQYDKAESKVEGDLDGNGIGYEKADRSIAAKIMGKSKKKRGKR